MLRSFVVYLGLAVLLTSSVARAQTENEAFIAGVSALLQRMSTNRVNKFEMVCANGCQNSGVVRVRLGNDVPPAQLQWDCGQNTCNIRWNGSVLTIPRSCTGSQICIRAENECHRIFKIRTNNRWIEFERVDCTDNAFTMAIRRDTQASEEKFRCRRGDLGPVTSGLTCQRL